MAEPKWQLQEAEHRLGELVGRAASNGPQLITSQGTEVAAVISMNDYRKLCDPPKHLVDVFLESPLRGEGIDLDRQVD